MTVTKEKLEATIQTHHAKIADAQATINQFHEGIAQKTSVIQQAIGAINLAAVILAELEAENKKAAEAVIPKKIRLPKTLTEAQTGE